MVMRIEFFQQRLPLLRQYGLAALLPSPFKPDQSPREQRAEIALLPLHVDLCRRVLYQHQRCTFVRIQHVLAAQLIGAVLGAWLAHAMFGLPVVEFSAKVRAGTGQCIAEAVATAGLLLVILRAPAGRASIMVAAYIGAAYWFTASTSFANPAAAFGRMFSNSFAGIAPSSIPGFVIAELAGAAIGLVLHTAIPASARAAGICGYPKPGTAWHQFNACFPYGRANNGRAAARPSTRAAPYRPESI